jgi:hypothetical protein
MASQLDPTWTEPGEHEKHLITYLTNLTELSESKVGQILCLMIAYALYCHKIFVARVSYRIVQPGHYVYWMCAHTLYIGCVHVLLNRNTIYMYIDLWFSLASPFSSTNKTCCHDIAEIMLKVAIPHNPNQLGILLRLDTNNVSCRSCFIV